MLTALTGKAGQDEEWADEFGLTFFVGHDDGTVKDIYMDGAGFPQYAIIDRQFNYLGTFRHDDAFERLDELLNE